MFMDDILGRIWTIIIGTILLFTVPAIIMVAKTEDLKEEYIEKAVHDFVDNAASTAVITDFGYRQLVGKISVADPNVRIDIWHSARYQTPIVNPDGKLGVYSAEEEYGSDYILSAMYPDDNTVNDYELKEGDYLQVVVTPREPTLSQRMMAVFMRPSGTVRVYESYGKYIDNNRR